MVERQGYGLRGKLAATYLYFNAVLIPILIATHLLFQRATLDCYVRQAQAYANAAQNIANCAQKIANHPKKIHDLTRNLNPSDPNTPKTLEQKT